MKEAAYYLLTYRGQELYRTVSQTLKSTESSRLYQFEDEYPKENPHRITCRSLPFLWDVKDSRGRCCAERRCQFEYMSFKTDITLRRIYNLGIQTYAILNYGPQDEPRAATHESQPWCGSKALSTNPSPEPHRPISQRIVG